MSVTTEQSLQNPLTTAGSAPGGDGCDLPQPGPPKAGDRKVPEKTISCVSCRKRKLKCDRTKPKCGTCTRLRHDCEYPERRRNLGSKRRNMKELEARLAQVETQLVSEQKLAGAQAPATSRAGKSMEADWNTLRMDMNLDIDDADLLDSPFEIPQVGMPSAVATPIPAADYFSQSQELLALGLQEPLPPQDMMDELYQIYFEKFHPTMPMMHKLRFYTSLDRSPDKGPPVCLRYAIWAMAASLSDKYLGIEDLMYERARKYIDAEEMKGHGEVFVTIYHAQAWGIIANYEAKKTYFSRSWMSTGRIVRLVHLLGLYRLDGDRPGVKNILPAARDWIELEERRRTFWAAFYCDRWASSGTGWPMIIDEKEIQTNLPASESSFENGIEEPTVTLSEALTPEGAPKISPFGGVVISATLFGHNFEHLHCSGPNENPHDLQNGEFWKRHRKMDNVLSNTFMFLPDQLRLPSGLRNMNVIFIHMNIHTSAICLHQAAVLTAERNSLDPNFIRQTHTRCLMAAEEITNIMRLVCHIDASNMHSWIGFCLYVASGIFIKDAKSTKPSQQSLPNLEFLLAAMRAIGAKHSVTKHFTAQLELDIEAAKLGQDLFRDLVQVRRTIPNTSINGLVAERQGVPMTPEDLQLYTKASSPATGSRGSESGHRSSSNSNIALTPLSGIVAAESSNNSSRESPDPAPASTSAWDTRTTRVYVPRSQVDPDQRECGCEPKSSDQALQSDPYARIIMSEIGRTFVDGVNNGLSSAQNTSNQAQKSNSHDQNIMTDRSGLFLDGTKLPPSHHPAGIKPFLEGTNLVSCAKSPPAMRMFYEQGNDVLSANSQPSGNYSSAGRPMQFPVRQAPPSQQEPLPTGAGIFNLTERHIPSFSSPAGEWPTMTAYDENAIPLSIEEELQDFISRNFTMDGSWGTTQPEG